MRRLIYTACLQVSVVYKLQFACDSCFVSFSSGHVKIHPKLSVDDAVDEALLFIWRLKKSAFFELPGDEAILYCAV